MHLQMATPTVATEAIAATFYRRFLPSSHKSSEPSQIYQSIPVNSAPSQIHQSKTTKWFKDKGYYKNKNDKTVTTTKPKNGKQVGIMFTMKCPDLTPTLAKPYLSFT